MQVSIAESVERLISMQKVAGSSLTGAEYYIRHWSNCVDKFQHI